MKFVNVVCVALENDSVLLHGRILGCTTARDYTKLGELTDTTLNIATEYMKWDTDIVWFQASRLLYSHEDPSGYPLCYHPDLEMYEV